MDLKESFEQKRDKSEHSAFTMLIVNGLFIGFAVTSFVQGPYSSREQELWYRYGSLGFFIAGVVIPAAVLLAFRRLRPVVRILTAWMSVVFLGFVWYLAMSGGGV